MIIVAGRFVLDPDAITDLEARARGLREASSREDGCIDYALLIEDRDAGHVFIFEVWRDRVSQERHLQLPPAQAFLQEFGPRIRSNAVVIYEASVGSEDSVDEDTPQVQL